MSNESDFPETYEQWRHWIEVLGKIELTPTYIAQRLAIYEDQATRKVTAAP